MDFLFPLEVKVLLCFFPFFLVQEFFFHVVVADWT